MPASWDDIYRRETGEARALLDADDEALEPNIENVTAVLLARSAKVRRRFLWLTLCGALLAGLASAALFVAIAPSGGGKGYGVVMAGFFMAGGLGTFAILHRLSGAVARGLEGRWARDLARSHGVPEVTLRETLQILE